MRPIMKGERQYQKFFTPYLKTYVQKRNGDSVTVSPKDQSLWTNVVDGIQEQAVGIDVYSLIARAVNNDTTAIPFTPWTDSDMTAQTMRYVDMQRTLENARLTFERLPLETRKTFNNDFQLFLENFDRFTASSASDRKAGSTDVAKNTQSAAESEVNTNG